MERVIIHIFKVLGALVLSLLLWAVVIGRPSPAKEGTKMSNYVDQGSFFEEFVYGDRVTGFKWLTGMTWLQATGYNGLQTELVTHEPWSSLQSTADSSTFATKIS